MSGDSLREPGGPAASGRIEAAFSASAEAAPGPTLELLKDNLTLVPFIIVGGGATSAFSLLMARALPAAAFGEAFAVLATLSLLATPSNVIQTVVARSTARFIALGRPGELRAGLRTASVRLVLAAALVAIAIVAVSPLLAGALRLREPWPVMLAGVAAGLLLIEPLLRGVTQGARDFVGLGYVMAAHGIGRIAVGAAAILTGGGATGALAASTGSALGGIGAGVLAVRLRLRGIGSTPSDAHPRVAIWDHARVAIILAVMAGLLHLDVVFVKAFHPDEVAADYAALALVARIVFWVGVLVAIVLLPYVVHYATRQANFVRVYLVSLGLMAVASAIAAAVVLSRPDFVYGVIFGDGFAPHPTLLPAYVGAASMLAVATITANLHIGASHLRVWKPLTAILALVLAGIALFHASPGQILAVMAVGDALAVAYLVVETVAVARRPPLDDPPPTAAP